MSEWIKCSDRHPENLGEVMVWRKWPGWDCFAPEFDRWETDESSDGCSSQSFLTKQQLTRQQYWI